MKHLSAIVFFIIFSITSVQAQIRFPANLSLPSDVQTLAIDVISSQCPYALQSNVTLDHVRVEEIEVDQGITDYRFTLHFSVINGNDYESLSMVIFKADISNPDMIAVNLESIFNNTGLCY